MNNNNNITCDGHSSPWEKSFKLIRTPLEEFVHDEATSGLLLMLCAVLAMILANSTLSHGYEAFLHAKIAIHIGSYALNYTVHHWINDALMALFFFVVGLEIKREVLVGELADLRQAALPVAGAIGGMIVPALIYFVFNYGGEAVRGWAIPMATDIAFAVGVLVLLGKRVPKALLGFLLALAIVDDLGAVIVIALFFTKTIVWSALLIAVILFALLMLCNRVGIRAPLPYFILGGLLWLAMLKSGVHATMAGILTAITVPARSSCTSMMFSKFSYDLLDRFNKSHVPGKSIMENSEQQAILQCLENGVHGMEAPLQRLEHSLHMWVSLLVIPIFAFANAGITIDFSTFSTMLVHPVTLGVIAGLVIGKFLGIFGACWLMLKVMGLKLPKDISMQQLAGVSFLAGIGFTMSIFIGELAFAGQEELIEIAKTGVMISSLMAGTIGSVWLYWVGNSAID